jgi:hypothetical protein
MAVFGRLGEHDAPSSTAVWIASFTGTAFASSAMLGILFVTEQLKMTIATPNKTRVATWEEEESHGETIDEGGATANVCRGAVRVAAALVVMGMDIF